MKHVSSSIVILVLFSGMQTMAMDQSEKATNVPKRKRLARRLSESCARTAVRVAQICFDDSGIDFEQVRRVSEKRHTRSFSEPVSLLPAVFEKDEKSS